MEIHRQIIIIALSFFTVERALCAPVCVEAANNVAAPSYLQIAEERVERLKALQSQPLSVTVLNPWVRDQFDGKPEERRIRGIPEDAKFTLAGDRVFRRYFREEKTRDEVVRVREIRSGVLPYVVISPQLFRATYKDLSGAFFTLPDTAGREVGVPESKFYLDVRLPSDTPMVELEKGKILLVPLPESYQPWVEDHYRRYLQGEVFDASTTEMLRKIEEDGGIHPPVSLPVTVIE